MSITLTKRAETVGKILLTKGINQAPTMRVGNALDISGSMDMRTGRAETTNIISSGKLQQAFDQTMAVAVKFDDNGELDVFAFDTRCDFVDTASPSNYDDFITRKRIQARGGTAYAPIVQAAIDFYFKPKKSGGFMGFGGKTEVNNMPVLFLIHTDGEPSDRYNAIKDALESAQQYPIYFHFVGVGGTRSNFPTIAKLADDLPNVGEVYLPRFDLSDEEVYSQLICDELVQWVAKFTSPQSATA